MKVDCHSPYIYTTFIPNHMEEKVENEIENTLVVIYVRLSLTLAHCTKIIADRPLIWHNGDMIALNA